MSTGASAAGAGGGMAGAAGGASSGLMAGGMTSSAPSSIPAIPVSSSTMSNGEFQQMYGMSRDQLSGINGIGRGISDAGQQYGKSFNTQQPPSMMWNPGSNQGYPFMQNLYTIKH